MLSNKVEEPGKACVGRSALPDLPFLASLPTSPQSFNITGKEITNTCNMSLSSPIIFDVEKTLGKFRKR